MKGDPRTWIGILEHGDWERPGTLEVGTWKQKKDTRSRICTLRGDTRSWTLEEGHCEWRLRDVH